MARAPSRELAENARLLRRLQTPAAELRCERLETAAGRRSVFSRPLSVWAEEK